MSNAKTEAIIKINNGQDVPLELQQILCITVSREVNKIPTAIITLKDGHVERQDFEISNQDLFKPGVPIEILIGTPQSKSTVFKGVVIKHGLKVKKGKPSELVVQCKDEAVRLTIGRKSRYWNDKSDSEIFKEIVDDYNQVAVEAEDSAGVATHNQMIQYYATDWDFISMRSEAIGQYLFVDDGKININKPKLTESPDITLEYGAPADSPEKSRIWEFESEMDGRFQFDKINTMGWDYSRQELTEGINDFSLAAEPGDISSDELEGVIELAEFELHSQARMDENELNAFANAVKQKSILNKTRGKIKIDGRADIKPGNMVALSGVGNRFNGNVFVARVHHTFEPGRWFSYIQFGLPYCWFHEERQIPNPPAQGLLPVIKGLQIGKVIRIKDEENPDKDFRVKVSIPGFHKKNEGVWARLATFHAGNNRGAIFIPELDEEVVVGYLGQDSREPVILGSLYSENNVPSEVNDDDNFRKGFFTKNQHKILFDDENNVITIETRNKNKVVLDDGNSKVELLDNNRNTVTLDASGISLKSGKDINIDAPTGSVNVSGLTISLNGTTAVNINHPSGGLVKMGNGILPAASLTDTIVPGGPPPVIGLIGPATKNVKVLI